jgi:hypothetical protein
VLSSVYLCFVPLTFLAACSVPSTGPPVALPKVEPDGVSPALTRSDTPTLYNLDNINSVVSPITTKPIVVAEADDLTVSGWAVDQSAQSTPAGIEVVVDGNAYRAVTGLNRIDVADHFKIPGYSKAGFSFSIPAGTLEKGRHGLVLRILLVDGKHYFESPQWTVNVE